MKPATALTLLAIGAILTFAISWHPRFLNLQVAGVVIMAAGAGGFFLPGKAQGWLRRRIVVRRPATRRAVRERAAVAPAEVTPAAVTPAAVAPAAVTPAAVTKVEDTRFPPYIMINPEAQVVGDNHPQPGIPVEETTVTRTTADLPADELLAEREVVIDHTRPTEVVEEYLDE